MSSRGVCRESAPPVHFRAVPAARIASTPPASDRFRGATRSGGALAPSELKCRQSQSQQSKRRRLRHRSRDDLEQTVRALDVEVANAGGVDEAVAADAVEADIALTVQTQERGGIGPREIQVIQSEVVVGQLQQ